MEHENLSSEKCPQGIVARFPATIRFPNWQEKGAFLVTQFPAIRRYLLPIANKLIHPYFIAHRESWFLFSRKMGRNAYRDDFVFISGQVETKQWAVGVSQRKNSVFTLEGAIGPDEQQFDISLPNDDCYARSGPERRFMRDKVGENELTNPFTDQSIFLNFYKARSRIIGPLKISATSGPHSFQDDHNRKTPKSNVSAT